MDISIMTLGVNHEDVVQRINEFTEYEDFVSAGMEARTYRDQSQWVLGCLAYRLNTKYGERTLEKFAKEIGIKVASLEGYRWTAAQYLDENPRFTPPPSVTFSILREAAKLPPASRDLLLEQAQIDHISVEKARVMVRQQLGKPIKPKFSVEFCEQHQRWQFIPLSLDSWEAYHD